MLWVCPATGHLFDRHVIAGHVLPSDAFCPHHGVLLFHECARCGERWAFTSKSYSNRPTHGTDFCNACGTPAPWLTREQKVMWIQHQIQASRDIGPATRDELVELLGRLQSMAPGDSKAIPGWEMIKARAPKVWEIARPVLVNIVSDELRKWLGL